ncbi:putative metal-binding motif-containing protein [Stigmatella sp. ncwal1]|uniref:Metal-binding motif-containing protein n=1 Tax=Stigmatella ashevillensis TaxID=2995309 RepID=A0ABT5DIV7_9BACT|nr:putative metal-binding motif-containing protein [Stigmatella ashevillena]MDC0713558.1 putative metal-binding motif-containing protein [Stigmatella ashevillena]
MTVAYTFRTQCLVVSAQDGDNGEPERQRLTSSLKQLQTGSAEAVVAVFRKASWSRTLRITATAYGNSSCEGSVLAKKESTVNLPETQIVEHRIDLAAPDEDEDGYIPADQGGADCNDTDPAFHPGVQEVCDGKDNNCDGNSDEGVGPNWYPDADGDTFGDMKATPFASCAQPASQGTTQYVLDNSDCLDSNKNVFPRKDVNETQCDEVDDDCDGIVDDGFAQKGKACSDPCPEGKFVCNDNHDGLACSGAPPKEPYYTDADGDGTGDGRSASAGVKCPKDPYPPKTVSNKDDCDDQDPYNAGGNFEVCDAQDNNCNSAVDEDDACMGKGWKALTDSALTGRNWKTVALAQNGWVWVAGDGGKLAVRKTTNASFSSLDGQCDNHDWTAAWARSDGAVFLSGGMGRVAWHDGTNCHDKTFLGHTFPPESIVGRFDGNTTRLYAVNKGGLLFTWTPGTSANQLFDLGGPSYFSIHTHPESAQLLLVGGTNEYDASNSTPLISGHPGTGGEPQLINHTFTGVPPQYRGYLLAVWMASPTLAYAVGNKGIVLKWNGNKDWSYVNLPIDSPVVDYTSVVALDQYSIYITDTEGRIRLLKPSGWAPAPLYDGAHALRDIAAMSMNDIWAVGDNGLVVHFAE